MLLSITGKVSSARPRIYATDHRMDTLTIVLFAMTQVLALSALFTIYRINRRSRFAVSVNNAVTDSAFAPTFFRVYDKSSADVCDRLINVQPFDWYVWACRGELYIINPEGRIICGAGSTPVIRITSRSLIETCLKLDYDSLILSYERNSRLRVIPYTITNTKRFTILSALNLMLEYLIKFDDGIKTRNEPWVRLDQADQSLSRTHRELTTTELTEILARPRESLSSSSRVRLLEERYREYSAKRKKLETYTDDSAVQLVR